VSGRGVAQQRTQRRARITYNAKVKYVVIDIEYILSEVENLPADNCAVVAS